MTALPRSAQPPAPEWSEVRSADGTSLGYLRLGEGPAVVLLHGAGQSSESFSALARALSGAFTVLVPDRRLARRAERSAACGEKGRPSRCRPHRG